MPSVATAPAAPAVGAALPLAALQLARLRELVKRLEAGRRPSLPRPLLPPRPPDTTSGPATIALARAHSAHFEARQARLTLRDDCTDAHRPGRFTRLRTAIIRLQATHAALATAATAYHVTARAAAERACRAHSFTH